MSNFNFIDRKVERDEYISLWKNSGNYFDKETGEIHFVPMVDALAHPNSTEFFPVTVNLMVREAAEPLLVMTGLLDRIQYVPGMQIGGLSIGAFDAADVDEASEYPETSLPTGTGARIITIGKSGIAFKYTDEMKRYSQYDMVGLYIKKMGQALARHKEKKIFAMFSKMGVPTHDNLNPSQSVFGTTTGRSLNGSANGSISMDDIYEAYSQVLMNGFIPDMLIVHPLTYMMFLTDPVMRAVALNTGNLSAWFNGWTGNPVNEYPFERPLGKMGPGGKKYGVGDVPKVQDLNIKAAPKLPSYLGLPLTVVVSPFVPYNPVTKLTDVYLVDSKNIGAILVDEEPTMEEIPDRLRDITKIKVRERYAIVPYNEGAGIAVMKNVKVTANKVIPSSVLMAPQVTEINRNTPIQ